MDFIRPELRARFHRWREALAGGGLVLLGLWAFFGARGVLAVLGAVAVLLGLVLVWTGVQRARFRRNPGLGPGSVDVDEGQVTYFGPLTGGATALRELRTLALIRSGGQSPHWQLSSDAGDLHIPIGADGADALFDAFATLPGLRVERMLAVLREDSREDVVIWRRSPLRALR